ncbi:MAG: RNA polymerase sigma factor [Chloroflexota bacterium]
MDVTNVVDDVVRREHGRVLSILIGVLGDFDLAEDALQETLVTALERWPRDGIPNNPAAWMITVGRRKAIDRLRREKNLGRKTALLADPVAISLAEPDMTGETAIPDERLKLIFTCCHPALSPEARVALTLRTLGGLTTAEIAHAFLVPVPTMNQRLTRAKAKIRGAAIPYAVPSVEAIPERLDAVLNVLYLIFNEGYAASAGDNLIRRELCAEAIRLTLPLVALLESRPELGPQPEALGLAALMLLHDSRRPARTDAEGEIILLEDQDRGLWDRGQIDAGVGLLDRAIAARLPGPYQIQAAIAALHAQAPTPAETDWPQIALLYGRLWHYTPSPVVELNRAVAVGMARGPLAGLALLQEPELAAALDGYHWYHAAVADFLRRASYRGSAHAAYVRALALCENRAERSLLGRRIAEL